MRYGGSSTKGSKSDESGPADKGLSERQGFLILISQGSFMIFFNRPIAAVFMVLAFLSIGRGIWLEFRERGLEVAEEDQD